MHFHGNIQGGGSLNGLLPPLDFNVLKSLHVAGGIFHG